MSIAPVPSPLTLSLSRKGRGDDGAAPHDSCGRLVRQRREWLADWIERAIALLDQIDGDPDLEADEDAEELAA